MKTLIDPLAGLNPAQVQAVECTEGPVLVLAGAGSGKTRVLAHRVANIVHHRLARPWQILAVTFTNKAAAEIRDRVAAIVPGGNEVAAGTFHAIFLRLLRREAKAVGYPRDFSIFDETDSVRLVKMILNEKGEDRIRPKTFRTAISRLKNDLITPDKHAETAVKPTDKFLNDVYREYERRLRHHAGMDFDDLLIRPLELFRQHPSVLEYWRQRWQYLHIDEYQDTNLAQFELLKLLGGPSPNLFVVGDDDQSIYGWRGARVENIFLFRETFKGAKVFRLEQNYRSTKPILELAHAVVSRSKRREEKKLWTELERGEKPEVVRLMTDLEEASEVADRIGRGVLSGKRSFRDYAILYRTNAQSRLFEDALRSRRYPYQILGSLRFYDRKEIRDALAYFKLCVNPRDDVSLRRIISEPPRGIGKATVERLIAAARERNLPLSDILMDVGPDSELAARAVKTCRKFGEQLKSWRERLANMKLDSWALMVLEESGYMARLEKSEDFESAGRLDNLQSLVGSIAEFVEQAGDEENATLGEFLEQVTLATDVDRYDPEADTVRLMTIHSAKGLEFPAVFITGLERGLFPLENGASDDDHDGDEERRLFYVAVTRAREELVLTFASSRRLWGQLVGGSPSRFLKELPRGGYKDNAGLSRAGTADLFARGFSAGTSWGRSGKQAHGSSGSTSPGSRSRGTSRQATGKAGGKVRAADIPAVHVGDLVEHNLFGKGMVVQTRRFRNDIKVSVEFEDGVHHLLQSIARLQPVKDF